MGSWAVHQSNQNPRCFCLSTIYGMQRVLDYPITMYVLGNCLPVAANHMLQFSSVVQRICTFDGHHSATYKGALNYSVPYEEHPPVNWSAVVNSILHISPIGEEISSHLQSVTATFAFHCIIRIWTRNSSMLCFLSYIPASHADSTTASHTAFLPWSPCANVAVDFDSVAVISFLEIWTRNFSMFCFLNDIPVSDLGCTTTSTV